jgi:hypothetical protein
LWDSWIEENIGSSLGKHAGFFWFFKFFVNEFYEFRVFVKIDGTGSLSAGVAQSFLPVSITWE